MTRVTVSLTEHLEEFVAEEVASGKYASAAGCVLSLIQMAYLEKHREQVEKLLLEGLNSGPATPMTAQDWQDIRQSIRKRLAAPSE